MKYGQLQEYQMKIISNGCGGKGGRITPPHAEYFREACNQHDLSYFLGNTEFHRCSADWQLRKDMVEKIKLTPVPDLRQLMLPGTDKAPDFLVRFLFKQWANLYFIGVRLVGWKFFYYDDEKQVLP